MHRARGSGLAPWPARLTTPPPRLAEIGYSKQMFETDLVIYQEFSITVFFLSMTIMACKSGG